MKLKSILPTCRVFLLKLLKASVKMTVMESDQKEGEQLHFCLFALGLMITFIIISYTKPNTIFSSIATRLCVFLNIKMILKEQKSAGRLGQIQDNIQSAHQFLECLSFKISSLQCFNSFHTVVVVIQAEAAPTNPKTKHSFIAFFTLNTIIFTLVAFKKKQKEKAGCLNWTHRFIAYTPYLNPARVSTSYVFAYNTDKSGETWAHS